MRRHVRPVPWHMRADDTRPRTPSPMNLGLCRQGQCEPETGRRWWSRCVGRSLRTETARGLGHDTGQPSTAASSCADDMDVQVMIHTDTLNESGFVENTIAAFKDRTIHAFPYRRGRRRPCAGHHQGVRSCQRLALIDQPDPALHGQHGGRTSRHADGLPPSGPATSPEDVAFAESRIRKETIAAEDILHDMGAFSIIASDSQAMGRVGEVLIRTWQTADKMKKPARSPRRRKRRQRQSTEFAAISPSTRSIRRSPMAWPDQIGSVEAGKRADLVVWDPAFFGVKPELVLIGGTIAAAVRWVIPNASIPTPQPRALPGRCSVLSVDRSNSPAVTFVTFRRRLMPGFDGTLAIPAKAARSRFQTDPFRASARRIHGPEWPAMPVCRCGSGNLRSARRRCTAHLRAGYGSAVRWPSVIFCFERVARGANRTVECIRPRLRFEKPGPGPVKQSTVSCLGFDDRHRFRLRLDYDDGPGRPCLSARPARRPSAHGGAVTDSCCEDGSWIVEVRAAGRTAVLQVAAATP